MSVVVRHVIDSQQGVDDTVMLQRHLLHISNKCHICLRALHTPPLGRNSADLQHECMLKMPEMLRRRPNISSKCRRYDWAEGDSAVHPRLQGKDC